MKKVYIIMAISVGLFSSVYAQENVAITDINTSPLSQAQCDVTRDFLYYEGVGGPRIIDRYIGIGTGNHHRFDRSTSGNGSMVSVYNPNNMVDLGPGIGEYQRMSSAKPANVDQVVAISFENGFGIEEITTPTSYERDQIAAQVVFDIKSWEYAVAPVIPENIFYRTELTSAQINETINRSALPITQSNGQTFSREVECANIYVGYCGDGVIDHMNQGNGVFNNGDALNGRDPNDLSIMEAFEDCDPAHPDYTAETCDPVTCRIIPTTCGDGVIQDPNDDGVSEQCEIGASNPDGGMFTDENCNNDCEIIPEEIVCTDFQVTIEVTQSCRPEVFFTVNGNGIGFEQLNFEVTTIVDGTPQSQIYEATEALRQTDDSYTFLLDSEGLSGITDFQVRIAGEDESCFEDFQVTVPTLTLQTTTTVTPAGCGLGSVTFTIDQINDAYEIEIFDDDGNEVALEFISAGENSVMVTLPAGTYEAFIVNDEVNQCNDTIQFVIDDAPCCEDIQLGDVVVDSGLFCEETTSVTFDIIGLPTNQVNQITIRYTTDPTQDIADWNSIFEPAVGGSSVSYTLSDLGPGEWTIRVQRDGDDEDCFAETTVLIEADVEFTLSSEPAQCDEIEEGSITIEDLDDNASYVITVTGPISPAPISVSGVSEYTVAGLNPGEYTVTVVQNGNQQCQGSQIVTVGEQTCECGDEGYEITDPQTMCNYLSTTDNLPDGGCEIPAGEDSCQYCNSSCEIVTNTGDPVCGDGTVDVNEECDDGNTIDNDECSNSCEINITEPVCGNEIIDENEECEEGTNDENGNQYTTENCNFDTCQIIYTIEPPVCGGASTTFFYVDPLISTDPISVDFSNAFPGDQVIQYCGIGSELVEDSIIYNQEIQRRERRCQRNGLETPSGDGGCYISPLYCGDTNVTDHDDYLGSSESCDDGEDNGTILEPVYTLEQQEERMYCNEACQFVPVEDQFCGDSTFNDPSDPTTPSGSNEVCDGEDADNCGDNETCNTTCGCTSDPVDAFCGNQMMIYDFNNSGDFFLDENGVFDGNTTIGLNVCNTGIFSGGSLNYSELTHSRTYVCESANDGNSSSLCGLTEKRCGDDLVNGDAISGIEECDDGEEDYDGDGLINYSGNNLPNVTTYNGMVEVCTTACEDVNVFGPFCGDGDTDQPQEECDNGTENNDGTTQVNGIVCSDMCQIIEDEELACHSLSAEFIVTYDDAGNQQVGVAYDCDASGTDQYQVVLKDFFGGVGNMSISDTATGVFTDDFITLENDYWLQCYLDGVPLHPANLFGNCQEDLYSNIEPELPECYGLNSVLTIDEIPGQIDFSCEGINGNYTVELYNDDTQVLLETSVGPEGNIFTGSFESLGEGDYRVECKLGDQVNTQVGCFERHRVQEDPVIVADSCEQLTIQGGTRYVSLPATIDYNCRGQPGPVDVDGFEVRVLDTQGNVVSISDGEGNLVSVLTEQSGSFVLTQEGDFTVSCEYNGVGSEQCNVPIHVELPEVGGVCEELLLSDDRIELGASIDLTCNGVGELFELIVTNQEGQEVYSDSSDQSFISTYTPQNSGVYDVVCLVDGNTSQLCEDTYTQRIKEKTTHRIKGIQRSSLVPTELTEVQPAVHITKYQIELNEIEKKTVIEASRACEDSCKGKFVVEKKEDPVLPTCEISEVPETVVIMLGEDDVSVTPLCSTTGLEGVSFTCSGGVRDGDACVYDSEGLYAIQCTQDGKPIAGCKDAVRVIKEDPQNPVCEIVGVPSDVLLGSGGVVQVTPICTTLGYENTAIDCGGGQLTNGVCEYTQIGMYTISCTTNGLPIQGCDDTIVIKKEQPPFPELKCELSYSPEDKIIEGVIHTIDITCDTVGYENTGVLCGDSVLSGSTSECVLSGEGSYQIGCTSNNILISGCQDIITLKQPEIPVVNFCGDGIIQTPNDDGIQEECDDGNTVSGDGCFECKEEGGGGFNGGGRRSSITSYCGDGVINVGEFCDEGAKNGKKNAICSKDCEVKSLPLPLPTSDQITTQTQTGEPPKCGYIDPPSIQAGELLPFWRGVEEGNRGVGCEDVKDAGNIDTLTMYCTFERLAPDGSAEQFTRSCITQDLKEANWYEDFIATNGSLGEYLGADVLDTSEFGFDTYGEYRIQLIGIDYEICEVEAITTIDGEGNETVEYTAKFVEESYEGRICQMNVAVTTPYYLNKGTSLSSTTDDKAILDNFADVAGNRLIPRVQESLSLQTANSQEFERMQQRARQAIPLATKLVGGSVLGTTVGLMKSPASEIYVAYEDVVIEGSRVESNTPRLLIIDGEYAVTIRGSLNANIMIIAPEGEIIFDAVSCDEREIVSGIYIAKYITGSKGLANDSMSTYDWCAGGGLTIKGMVIGSNSASLSRLVMRRRSTLENRFEGNKDITQKVFDGASLRIDNDAIQWTSLPPLASDMLETLQVIRQ